MAQHIRLLLHRKPYVKFDFTFDDTKYTSPMYHIHVCNGKGTVESVRINSVSALEIGDIHLYGGGSYNSPSLNTCNDWLWIAGSPMDSWPACVLNTSYGTIDLPVSTQWTGYLFVMCEHNLTAIIDTLPPHPTRKL